MYSKPSFFQQALGMMLLVMVLLVLAAVLSGAAALFIGAIFYFTWNHGAVHFINTSLNGDVAGVTYWTAFFATWFISLIGTILKGTQVNASS